MIRLFAAAFALLALATVALDTAYADPPLLGIDVPGLTGPHLTPEPLTVIMVCGVAIAMVERTRDTVALWVGLPLVVRGQLLRADPQISNRLDLSGIYPGRDWGCKPASKPKGPEMRA